MESEFQQHHFLLHDHQHQRPRNSGLIRYQSAPSSYFSSFGDRESIEEFLDRPTSPETERILSGFLQTTDTSNNVDSFLHHTFSRQNSGGTEKKHPEVKTEEEDTTEIVIPATAMEVGGGGDVGGVESIGYASVVRSLGQNKRPREKDDRTPANNLARHNSSPAGLFSSIDVETAYAAVMKTMGGFGGGNVMNMSNTEASSLTPRSKLPPSASRPMSSIPEIDDVKPGFSSRLPPRTLSGGFNRSFGNEGSASSKLTAISRTQSGGLDQYKTKDEDSASRRPPLAHHMSLPKSLSDIEQLLSDSIPCKIRAKRGCATHPRSIAERVRRTKISERMRKLQDLVPNMDTVKSVVHSHFLFSYFHVLCSIYIYNLQLICSKQTQQICWILRFSTSRTYKNKSRGSKRLGQDVDALVCETRSRNTPGRDLCIEVSVRPLEKVEHSGEEIMNRAKFGG